MAMHKIFEESSSRRADYQKVAMASEKNLFFCTAYWMENPDMSRRHSWRHLDKYDCHLLIIYTKLEVNDHDCKEYHTLRS